MQLGRGLPLAGCLLLVACSSGLPRTAPEATTGNAPVSLAGPANPSGKPGTLEENSQQVTRPEKASLAQAGRAIYFSGNNASLSESSKEIIRQHAAELKQTPKRLIVLRAYLDSPGSRSFALAIMQKRLDAVVEAFRAQGVPRTKIRQVMAGQRGRQLACASSPCQNTEQRIELLYK